MKKAFKFLSLFVIMCLTVFVFTVKTQAKESINLTVKNTAKGVVLTWNGDKNESYSVYKKTGKGKYVKTDKVKGSKYTDKSVISGESYSYCIKKNKKEKSKHLSVIYISAPVIKDYKVSLTGITVAWNASQGAEKYEIYRKAKGEKKVKLSSTQLLSYTDTSAQTGKLYTYTVKSVKADFSSGTKGKVTAVRLECPQTVSLIRTADGLELNWKGADGAKEYIIYRRKTDGGKWKKIAAVASSELSFEDTSVKSGEKYSYYVKAANGKSKSFFDGNFLSKICIKAPENFSVKQNNKKITLKWKNSAEAKKYQIYKKTGDSKWKKLADVSGGKNEYTDTLKKPTVFVSYKIRMITEKGKSAFSLVKTNKDVDPSKPMVALTYDDGPHPEHTDTILDILEKYSARATFFVVGERIASFSECLKRQNELGCEIANHSYSHVSLSDNSDEIVLEQIEKTDKLIKKYSGQACTLVRAPGGSVGKAAKLADRPFIHWSVDTMDWYTRSSSDVISCVKENVRDGSIILMHDLYESTAEASKVIIPWLIKEGYQLVTVSQMMEAKGIELEGGKVYYNGYT